MTIWYPDVSNFNNLTIEKNTVAVFAKATEGYTFTDGKYNSFKAQAHNVGAVFGGYHYFWNNTMREAQHAYAVIGKTPAMLDFENVQQSKGADTPTVNGILSFVDKYRSLGGVMHLVYLPPWFWRNNMHSPDLRPLALHGLSLVSSDYTTYSDSGPGWNSYGGVTPKVWQYTDHLSYGGAYCDFNAYKGTVTQFRNLITTGLENPVTSPTPANNGRTTNATALGAWCEHAIPCPTKNDQPNGDPVSPTDPFWWPATYMWRMNAKLNVIAEKLGIDVDAIGLR